MSLVPVLIVSYFFPPQGGAGTQRFAKFVKWLPAFGYRPIVVTSAAPTSPSAPTSDESLNQDIPQEAVILRVPSEGPMHLPAWKRFAMAMRFRIDQEEWVVQAEPIIRMAIEEYDVQVMIITVSPYAAAVLGECIKREVRLPWLLDLRDPWSLDGWRMYPSKIHGRYDLACMKRALREADLIIANTPNSKRAFIELAKLKEKQVCVIPNGFDSEDFALRSCDSAGRFRIIHVGTLHRVDLGDSGRLGKFRRFRWRQIERDGRTGRYLFLAIAEIMRRRPELYQTLSVELFGHVDSSHEVLARQLGINEVITDHGYVPHHEATMAMCSADAVFVPLHGLPAGDEALIVPGKLYEALASERFILGCVPEGDAARLIRHTHAGAVCEPTDVAGIVHRLIEAIESWRNGVPKRGATRELLQPFSRKDLTRRLARALDSVRGVTTPDFADDPWDEL